MTVSLELPDELEADLTAEAARLGLSLPEYVLRILTTSRPIAPPPSNGAELVAYWDREGLFGTRPDITDSAQYARELWARAVPGRKRKISRERTDDESAVPKLLDVRADQGYQPGDGMGQVRGV